MSSDVMIKLNGLSKTYEVYANPIDRLKQLVVGVRRRYFRAFTAVKSLDLEVSRGEVIGFVGRNGAGKSTLLQLICGTLTPSSGELVVKGKISALLELGAGFNLEFTGRENIYLAASLVGLSRQEIKDLEEDIIDFSGIRRFIDQPVKTYSSGMFVRLAFSVATSVDPDILVIDEALSVGDGEFAKRSFDRIMQMRDAGKTILFCSHSLYQIEQLCDRVYWIDAGGIRAQGAPAEVVKEYQGYLDKINRPDSPSLTATSTDVNSLASEARITRVTVSNTSADNTSDLVFETGKDSLSIDVELATLQSGKPPGIAVIFNDENGFLVSSCGSWEDGFELAQTGETQYRASVEFPQLPLLKGVYKISVMLFCDRGLYVYDEINEAAYIRVVQKGSALGVVSLNREWSGGGHLPAVDSPKTAAPVLQPATTEIEIRPYEPVDEAKALSLFEQCFGAPMDKELWRWKYRQSTGLSQVAVQGQQIVGFFGVVPRESFDSGLPVQIAQISDVMVNNQAGGGLGRARLFERLKSAFTHAHVGEGARFKYAFGFPTERAFALGEKRKVYSRVDEILRLNWRTKTIGKRTLGWRQFDRADAEVLNELWESMRPGVSQLVINVRNADWVGRRYFDRPKSEYTCLIFYKRWSGAAVGFAVLRSEGGGSAELMDLVAPKNQTCVILEHILHLLPQNGVEQLFALVTPQVAEVLANTDFVSERTGTFIPGDEIKPGADPLALKGRWWLIGGDVDSR